ncbi:hypothetical protein DL764_005588 [Monosporascus ibericus]|uniref:Uncharacterized protein n=1 Tax=Monosporascus ibericus TaxID=155417 RepID=A0A4Q4T8H7_9PEZI|nr:hypothetical protein DL764_005588 [Monosporascus ibericus]
MAIGAILQTSPSNVPHMIVGRIFTGTGKGINTANVAMWETVRSKSTTEAPCGLRDEYEHHRLLSEQLDQLQEEHEWFIAHEREKEATEILADVENKPIDDPETIADHQEVDFSVEYERQNATRWWDPLRGRAKATVSLPTRYAFYPETANCTLVNIDAYTAGTRPCSSSATWT